jgi:hypothetical protein
LPQKSEETSLVLIALADYFAISNCFGKKFILSLKNDLNKSMDITHFFNLRQEQGFVKVGARSANQKESSGAK